MSYGRPAQSKAQNEANAKALRAMVKQPGNKVCADCKRNDPRWASWNLGCFLCIRCSGIHRSMGTHISKVKSIDLDIWTPEQMDSVTKWGNHRSNLYWEAHLKPGHEPPEHKVESFIRSKYESRRWAKEGPPPSDPSTLEPGGGGSSAPTPTPAPQTTQNTTNSSSRSQPTSSTNRTNATASAPPRKSAIDLLGGDDEDGFQSKPPQQQSQPQSVNSNAPPKATPTTTAAAPKPSGGGGGLFDLDWHEPQASNPTSPTVTSGGGAKGKNDILSLFSNNTAPPQQQFQQQVRSPGGMSALDSFGGMNLGSNSASSPTNSFNNFGGASNQSQSQNQNPLMGGGMGMSDPWASNSNSSTNQIGNKPSGSGVGAGSGIFDSHDIWGTPAGSNSNGAASVGNGLGGAKKDNAFDDLWSDFK